MNFQTDNVQWTENLEKFLKILGEHSLCLSILHKDSEAYFSSKAMKIDLPVIVFSTLCGSLTLSAKNIFGEENENNALKFVGSLSLITGILGTVQSYFGYNRCAENHRISYLQYSKLYRFIKIQLGLPREQRILPKDLLKIVAENFERLNEISNLIPEAIAVKFRKKYKKETIHRPEVVNGLEQIEIYIPSDELINRSNNDERINEMHDDLKIQQALSELNNNETMLSKDSMSSMTSKKSIKMIKQNSLASIKEDDSDINSSELNDNELNDNEINV